MSSIAALLPRRGRQLLSHYTTVARYAAQSLPAELDRKSDQRGSSIKSFRFSDLKVTLAECPRQKPPLEGLKFGQAFSDHMFVAEYNSEEGWAAPEIVPFGPVAIHPAAQVLHYGISCFEGMKAYMGVDGRGRLFRPMMNLERFQRSAARLMLASFNTQELLECLKELLRVDRSWVPNKPGYSIYIRPFMYSAGENLGVSLSQACSLSIIMSPVGPYFSSGLQPVNLFLDEQYVRAWPQGVGQFKIAGNYAPTLQPQVSAKRQHGTAQVLYTMPDTKSNEPDNANLSESGAMNFMLFLKHSDGSRELVTPPLDGTILPGITRDSILQLCRQWGEFEVSERSISIAEVRDAAQSGRLLEMFGCGTACIVQPVATLIRADGTQLKAAAQVDDPRSLASRITRQLLDIQYGVVPHEWGVPFE